MSFQTYAFNYTQAITKDIAENNYPEVQSVIINIIVNNIHIMKSHFSVMYTTFILQSLTFVVSI